MKRLPYLMEACLTLHMAEAVGFLGRSRPQSVSVLDNAQVRGCVISPSHLVLCSRAHVPTWAAYLLPVRSLVPFFHSHGFTQWERSVRHWIVNHNAHMETRTVCSSGMKDDRHSWK
jgi:hypothetical protein